VQVDTEIPPPPSVHYAHRASLLESPTDKPTIENIEMVAVATVEEIVKGHLVRSPTFAPPVI
jgi:hypothetical protein